MPSSGGAPAEDPLAELARIVGGGPVPRRDTRLDLSRSGDAQRQPANAPPAPSVSSPSWAQRIEPAPKISVAEAPPPRIEPSFQPAAIRAEPPPKGQFATIEDDIERLLQHNPQRPAPRRPDDLENAMRSLDNLLRAKQAVPDPRARSASFEEWSIRPTAVETPAAPSPAAPPDFESALSEAASAQGYQPTEAAPPPYRDDRSDQNAWAETAAPHGELESVAAENPSRSRRPLMMVAAVLGVAAIGVGGALSMRGEGSRAIGGQPPVIVADKGPMKVAPANPGGLEIPDQNRQILERSPTTSQRPAKVVNSEEQPLDLKEAVRREAAASTASASDAPGTVASIAVSSIAGAVAAPPAYAAAPTPYPRPLTASDLGTPPAPPSAANAQPPAPPADAAAPTGGVAEPRRVRTVAIKPPEPGATRIEPTTPLPQPAPPPVAAAPAAPPAVEPRPAPTPAPAASIPVAAEQSTPAAAPPAPQKPKVQGSIGAAREAARQAPRPAPRAAEAINDAAAGSGPLQITPPARRPVDNARPTQRLAAVEPPAPIIAPSAAPESRASAPSGNFVVQLASEGNDESARGAISRLQSRFSELGPYSSSIQKREVRGQMRYRVRFGNMPRETASALCASLKGKGQDCILQPN